jgi:hypothetical protein
MLEKPDLKDGKIIRCLRDDFLLSIKEITLLPLGTWLASNNQPSLA